MITLGELTWSNAFSYGSNNTIDLSGCSLLQLVGKNGFGKSSIPLIIEEVIYNKNSKGIKKSDIINRYVKDKAYSISLSFTKYNDKYTVKTVRGSTQTVKLFHNGEDISAHTSTATYKMIENIIGLDHKTFSQIVYQNSATSLEFLTATDTARKKFLIDLLNLNKYTKAFDIFKELTSEVSKEVDRLITKKETITNWLSKFDSSLLQEMPIQELPLVDELAKAKVIEYKSGLLNIVAINKARNNNNLYKSQLDSILLDNRVWPFSVSQENLLQLEIKKADLVKQVRDCEAFVGKFKNLEDNCPLCKQPVNHGTTKELVAISNEQADKVREELKIIQTEIVELRAHLNDKIAAETANADWEKYHLLYNSKLETELLVDSELKDKITGLEVSIKNQEEALSRTIIANTKATAHNTKIKVLEEQEQEMNKDLLELNVILAEKVEKLSTLQVLVKTFSTGGLVAYKIECLVKDLEALTNEYLAELYDGRFQLSFQMSASDKLNVVINDNGHDIDILALSSGERARVNIATLLAIRKLMQSLSNARINLLVLDETVETLDAEGKERLIEVLLKEESLNTILVSHGFQHPLVEKLHVVKENNISRLE